MKERVVRRQVVTAEYLVFVTRARSRHMHPLDNYLTQCSPSAQCSRNRLWTAPRESCSPFRPTIGMAWIASRGSSSTTGESVGEGEEIELYGRWNRAK